MTNTTRRWYLRALALALVAGGLMAAVLSSRLRSSTEVVHVDDTTTTGVVLTTPPATEATTTAVPSTTTVAPASTTAESTPVALEPQALEEQTVPIPDKIPEQAPPTAIRVERGKCVADEDVCNPPATSQRLGAPASARCPEWWDVARSVGWPEGQLPTMDRVMKCESGCSPAAHNPSGASGLMQLMPGWWRGIGDPYDPAFNLERALHVLSAQGWGAWECY